MLQSLLFCVVVISSVEAFVPPRFSVQPAARVSSRNIILLRSVVDDQKVGNSKFDKIEDDGDLNIDIETSAAAGIGGSYEEGIDKMLNQALADSVKSVQDILPPELQDGAMNVMEDESFKKEVVQLFDKGSNDLKAALDEIRIDQKEFARQSAERSAAKTQAATVNEKARLDQAQATMGTIIGRVNKETAGVERAVEDLKKAQNSLSGDPLMQMASGGIAKQSALAGTILFTLRSGAETVAMLGGDATHVAPALIQGALALACAAYFFFV
jgi:hypothetical protein